MGFDRIRTTLLIGLIAAAAVWLNLHAPTLFFDTQMMVGGSLGVFALLQFGWPGLVVGLAALTVTYVRWGHPFELIVGMGFLVWLQFFVVRFNSGLANRGNGRILLAAVAYWLLLGFWLEVASFGIAFRMDAVAAVGLGLKEMVTGLSNVTLGFLLFAVVDAVRHWRETGGIRHRELAVGLVLAATTLPALALVFVLSGQVKDATLRARLAEMRAFGTRAASQVHGDGGNAAAARPGELATPDGPVGLGQPVGLGEIDERHFAVREAGDIIATSDPELFARLARDYVEELPSRTGMPELRIYRPNTAVPVITSDAGSFLFTNVSLPGTATDGDGLQVTVVEPLDALVHLLDYQLILPSFSVILGFLVVGAIVSSVVDTVSDRRVQAEQSGKEAERRLREATERMRLAALAAGFGFWTRDLVANTEEWDDPMLHIYGVSREEFDGRWEPFLHPDDKDRVAAEAQRAIDEGRFGEYVFRIIRPDGEIRHLKGMSQVLRDATGRAYLDLGVDIDITKQVEAEAALAAARAQESRHEEMHRLELEKKLKTSLSAAAIAHEINQPLSRVILRARMGLEHATAANRDVLAAVVADAERVVSVIEKMKVLLRNVETVQREVELAAVTASGLHQVKRPLSDAGVTVSRRGLEHGCLVLGDDVQLQLIIVNLLTNAVEAIVAGTSLRREVEVALEACDGAIELVVGDSGPGWPGGTLDDVLLRSTKAAGAGIGLYVVKTAVENHRGQIFIGRSPLGGAEFRIRFPGISGEASAVSAAVPGRGTPVRGAGAITESVERTLAGLQASETRFRNFFNLPLIGTAITSRTKGWVEVNDKTCEILGYTREELFQKTWAEITHPDDLAADEAQFERMLCREIDGYQLEKRFIRKDGTVVHAILAGGCGPIGNVMPETFYVTILDITDRKITEEKLRVSEERHRLLADNAADVINVIDSDGRLLYVSPSVERLIGYTQEEALKLSIEDILLPEAAAGARAGLAATVAAIEAGDPLPEFQGEFPHRHKDGSTVWAEATSTCMVDSGGTYVATLVVTRDISKRKQLEAELAAAREREKLAEQQQRELIEQKLRTSLNAAALAHEINQPLSRILLRARLDLEKESGADKDTLRALIADAERVVETIEKMKVLLRNVETVQHRVDVEEVVRSSLHQLKQSLQRGRITVTHCGPAERCVVLGDEVQLQMIVTSLLRNAIEAIIDSDRARRDIFIALVPHDTSVELVIGDSGPGWPGGTFDEVLLRTSKRQGSGIGLYVVKTAVENHRGEIAIGSSPLGGAEFRISLARVHEAR